MKKSPAEFEWYIERLKNKILSKEWNQPDSQYKPSSTHSFLLKDLSHNREEHYESMLCESLLTGFSVDGPILAFRCFKQATEYLARLAALGVATYPYTDYASALQLRIEEELKA